MQVFLITLAMALVFAAIVCALPHIIFGIWWAIACLFHLPAPPYAPFGWTALALVLALWLVMAYGCFFGRFRLWVNRTDYTSSDLPAAFDGYRVVHISDLHLSTFDDRPAALQRVVDSVNTLQPDLICFTGDLVTMGVAEAQPYTRILRGLHATDGVVSVLGNHDLLIYSRLSEEQRLAEVERLAAFERDTLGWQLLRNQHLTIKRSTNAPTDIQTLTATDPTDIQPPTVADTPDMQTLTPTPQTLTIIGVDNSSCDGQGFRTIYSGDLPQALQGTDGFRLLLSHDPSQWMAEIVDRTPVSLTLSGHTHAGQVRLFGHPLSDLMFHESAGWYHHSAKDNHSTAQDKPHPTQGLQSPAPNYHHPTAQGCHPDTPTIHHPAAQSLYVNEGIGCTAPIRINCPSEITLITLHSTSPSHP